MDFTIVEEFKKTLILEGKGYINLQWLSEVCMLYPGVNVSSLWEASVLAPDPSCVKRRLHENSLDLSRGDSTCKCFPTTGISHLECGDGARDEERHLEIG